MSNMDQWVKLYTGEEAAKAGRVPWKTWDEYIDAYWQEHRRQLRRIRTSKWSVGFNDRGMGHGDYAVLASRGKLVVAEVESKEMAEMLVKMHNTKRTKRNK